jgi:hypothetical protein
MLPVQTGFTDTLDISTISLNRNFYSNLVTGIPTKREGRLEKSNHFHNPDQTESFPSWCPLLHDLDFHLCAFIW